MTEVVGCTSAGPPSALADSLAAVRGVGSKDGGLRGGTGRGCKGRGAQYAH